MLLLSLILHGKNRYQTANEPYSNHFLEVVTSLDSILLPKKEKLASQI
ncbi:hypothetical protein NEOC65_001962 [Neochlamydia sp. AcF65]|nr:hypothetical protein [Neochlamydia sp. AcF65]MBS4169794.1 hypothetical protein [Neochlamydia sp. AcF95]